MAHGSSRLRRTKRMLILDPFLVSDGCQVQPVTRYCVATILNQTLTVSRPTLHLRVLFVTEWQLETHDRFLQGLGFFFFFLSFFCPPALSEVSFGKSAEASTEILQLSPTTLASHRKTVQLGCSECSIMSFIFHLGTREPLWLRKCYGSGGYGCRV